MPAEHDFSYLAPHLSKWNKSKLPMFIKFYTMRCNFKFFFEKIIFDVVFVASKIAKI